MDNKLKIRRVSTVLWLACTAYLVLRPLLAVVIWLNLDTVAHSLNPVTNLPLRMEFISATNLGLGFLVGCLPMGLMLYGVWRLRQLFAEYRNDALFTPANASHLHAFATMLLLTVVSSPLVDILQSVALTMNYPTGERIMRIDFSSSDLSMIFVAGLMFAVAWIIREGHRLAAENAEFV